MKTAEEMVIGRVTVSHMQHIVAFVGLKAHELRAGDGQGSAGVARGEPHVLLLDAVVHLRGGG